MCMVTQQDLIKMLMTVAGDEQCSLLMLQCELTVLSQPRVPYCMKEGKIPVLIWLSTPYLHCTCTLKGWKNLAENKEKKDAALKKWKKLLSTVWSNRRRICNLQRKQSQAPSIATCCGCDGNSNSGAKQNNLDCLWSFPLQSTETFILKRKHLWVLFWGLCLKMCKHFVTVGHKFPRKPLLQNFKTEKTGNTFSAGSCRTGKALLKSFLKQQST